MTETIRRIALVAALVGIIVCIVLLLNFTASNPTHRRYSSRVPLTTGQANGNAIGLDAEQILAKDLGVPRNEERDQRKCLCGTSGKTDPTQCNTCIVSLASITTYRVPDFVSSKFIADSKNQRQLLVQDRDFEQLRDYAEAAEALGIPLWVFTRVNTTVDPEYREVVRSTGGDIVYYFAVPGYEDPTDEAAEKGIVAAVIVVIITGAPELPPVRVRLDRVRRNPALQGKAVLNDAERLLAAMKDKARRG